MNDFTTSGSDKNKSSIFTLYVCLEDCEIFIYLYRGEREDFNSGR